MDTETTNAGVFKRSRLSSLVIGLVCWVVAFFVTLTLFEVFLRACFEYMRQLVTEIVADPQTQQAINTPERGSSFDIGIISIMGATMGAILVLGLFVLTPRLAYLFNKLIVAGISVFAKKTSRASTVADQAKDANRFLGRFLRRRKTGVEASVVEDCSSEDSSGEGDSRESVVKDGG